MRARVIVPGALGRVLGREPGRGGLWRARAGAGAVALAALAGACGQGAPEPVRAGGPLVPAASPPAGPGDEIVATVDGRPVWASCVAAQAARGARTARAALDECIDFELLAQAALARAEGRAPDPALAEAQRTALVSRLVATDLEARYRTPDDLRAEVAREVARFADQLELPELRASAFARVEVPAGAPPAADAAARAVAEQIAGALAGEAGLLPIHLREAADRIGAGSGQRVTHGSFRVATREGVVPPYGAALFAIPEAGRIAAPARTPWGWDVILLTQLVAPQVHTRDEIAARVFPDVRRRQFYRWVNQIAGARGTRVELDEQRVAALLDPGGSGAPGGSGGAAGQTRAAGEGGRQ